MLLTRRATTSAAVAVALLAAGDALAHDPVPAGVTPLFADDGTLAGGYANFGFVLLEDDVPRWVCEEVLPRAETDVWLAPDGALVVSTRGGVHRSTDGGCTWQPADGIDTLLSVAGLAPDPARPQVVWAATAATADANALYRSDDGGASFVQVAAPAPDALLRDPLVDPERDGVWVAGYEPDTNTERLFLVDAATGEAQSHDDMVADLARARPLGIDPNSGELLLAGALSFTEAVLRRCAPEAGCVDVGTRSGDELDGPHGFTSATVFEGVLWATFTDDVLYRREAGGVLEATDGPSRCVTRSPVGELVGCARIDQGTAFMMWDGASWAPTFPYADVQPRTCPDDTLATQACPILWDTIRGFGVGPALDADAGDDPLDAGFGGDAGTDDGSPAASEGCAAAAGRAHMGGWIALLAVATTRRRRG